VNYLLGSTYRSIYILLAVKCNSDLRISGGVLIYFGTTILLKHCSTHEETRLSVQEPNSLWLLPKWFRIDSLISSPSAGEANCLSWTGSEWCLSIHDRLLPLIAALWVCAMWSHRWGNAVVVLLSWCVSALMCWSIQSGAWKLAGWVCECFSFLLGYIRCNGFFGECICFLLVVDPILVC
jgi:hypothetical protein